MRTHTIHTFFGRLIAKVQLLVQQTSPWQLVLKTIITLIQLKFWAQNFDSVWYRDYDWISQRFLSVYVRVRSCLKSSPSSVIFITSVTFHFWWISSVAHVRKVCHDSNRDSSDILWNEIRVADVACSVRNNISRKLRSEKNVFENNCLIVFRTLGYSYDVSYILN